MAEFRAGLQFRGRGGDPDGGGLVAVTGQTGGFHVERAEHGELAGEARACRDVICTPLVAQECLRNVRYRDSDFDRSPGLNACTI